MAENKFKVFAENASSTDILTDENYAMDVTRIGGNTVGIARRAPNNKALKQATLISTAIGDYLASGDKGVDVNDELTHDQLAQYITDKFTNQIKDEINSSDTVVHRSGNETISDIKTFSTLPESPETPVKGEQLTTKSYVDGADAKILDAANRYTDEKVADALEAAKDYTDSALEGIGDGGGTGGAVLAPEIISPANGAVDVIISTDFTAGPFRTAYPDNTRTARQFQITQGSWGACEVDTEVNADSLSLEAPLKSNSDYKWRCRDFSFAKGNMYFGNDIPASSPNSR